MIVLYRKNNKYWSDSQMKTKQKTIIYNSTDIINELSAETGQTTEQLKEVITALKDLITKHIKETSTDSQIVIKPFDSFSIQSEVIPDRKRILNYNEYVQTARIKVKPKFTRYYLRNLINEL